MAVCKTSHWTFRLVLHRQDEIDSTFSASCCKCYLKYYWYVISNVFACPWLVLTSHMTKYSPAKTGECPRIFPKFHDCAHCEKDMKDNKCNSLHLGRKYGRIFVLGHYLFLEAQFSSGLLENCSLLRTDNVCGHMPNGCYCLYLTITQYPSLSLTLRWIILFN